MILHDGCTSDPKILRAGPEASWLWVCAIDYSRRHLTDGVIEREVLPTLGAFRRVTGLADRLVEVGLFRPHPRGYEVNNYLRYNDSGEVVRARRGAAAQRTARWRERHSDAAVTASPSEPALRSDDVEGPGSDAGVTASQAHTYDVSDASHARLSRARDRAFGVGVGTALRSCSSEEGEPEGEGRWLADDLWQVWRRTAEAHGHPLRLGASPRDTAHLMELAAAYSREELTAALDAWWASPHVTARQIGMFRAQVAEVLAHLDSPARRRPFRAPARPATRQGPDVPSHTTHECPHTPACAGQWACERRSQLEAAKMAARAQAS